MWTQTQEMPRCEVHWLKVRKKTTLPGYERQQKNRVPTEKNSLFVILKNTQGLKGTLIVVLSSSLRERFSDTAACR